MGSDNRFDLSSIFFEEKNIPSVLYHYTSMTTFIELMKEKACFYSTHFSFLNDELEIAYGEKFFDSFLKRNYPVLSSEYDQEIKQEQDNNSAWFITSFSEVGDDLGQWRAYTDRIDGGVSIGIKTKELLQKISYDIFYESGIELSEKMANFFREQKPVNILKCMYQQDEIQHFLQHAIDWIDHDYKVNRCRQDSVTKKTLRNAYLGNLCDLRSLTASFAKNSSFSQEKEWRIVVWKDFVKEHLVTFGGKPRLKAFDFDHKNMIDSITISPHGNQKKNYMLAKILCAERHLSSTIIKKSQSSYIG